MAGGGADSPLLLCASYGCETWTLNTDLERQINACYIQCLQNHGVLLARHIPEWVITLQDWFTVYYPHSVNAYSGCMGMYQTSLTWMALIRWAVSVMDNPDWKRSVGCPQVFRLEQVVIACVEVIRMRRGHMWRLAWRNPWDWLWKVN